MKENNEKTENQPKKASKKKKKKTTEKTENQPKNSPDEEKEKKEAAEKTEKKSAKKKPDKAKENTTDNPTEDQQQNQPEQQPSGEVSKAIKEMTHSDDNKNTEQKSKNNNPPKSDTQLIAKNIMQTDFPWANPEDTVQQLLNQMQQLDIEYVLIGENNVPTGIVSKTDLNSAISPYLKDIFSKWKRPLDDASLKIKCKWIMTSPVHTIEPDFTLTKLVTYMHKYRLKCLPVVDMQGEAVGLVTAFDVFEAILKQNTTQPQPTPLPSTP